MVMMKESYATDYDTYSQIKWELHRPIQEDGLDFETMLRLYESKRLYLERLRVKCFLAINMVGVTAFTLQDYSYILIALQTTKERVKQLQKLFKKPLSHEKIHPN